MNEIKVFGLKRFIMAFQPAAKRAAIDLSDVEKSQ
jgi:hypothetical protein